MKLKKLALFLGFCGLVMTTAHARDVIVFGDSLSDIGQKGWEDTKDAYGKLHHKASFQNKDGQWNKLYAEDVAQALGSTLKASTKGGTNYAYSGGVIKGEHADKNFEKQPNVAINNQVDSYLKNGVKSQNLHILWAGGNDLTPILTSAVSDAMKPDADKLQAFQGALKEINETADLMGQAWGKLHSKGVDYVIAPDAPNIGLTPVAFSEFMKSVDGVIRVKSFNFAGDFLFNSFKEIDGEKTSTQLVSGAFENYRLGTTNKSIDTLLDHELGTFGKWLFRYKNVRELFQHYKVSPDEVRSMILSSYGDFMMASGLVTGALNGAVTDRLNRVGGNIVRIPVNALMQDIFSRPGAYGFKNVVSTICSDAVGTVCKVGNTDKSAQAYDGFEDLFFTDPFHPSPKAHKVVADLILESMNTPWVVKSVPNQSLIQAQDSLSFLIDENARHFGTERPETGTTAIAQVQGDAHSGGNYRVNVGMSQVLSPRYEATFLMNHSETKVTPFGSTLNTHQTSLMTSLRYDAGHWWTGVAFQGALTDMNLNRQLRLGDGTFHESSTPKAFSLGGAIFGGWAHHSDQFNVTITGDFAYQHGRVQQFDEKELQPWMSRFDAIRYNALTSRVGFTLDKTFNAWTPYVGANWNQRWAGKINPVTTWLNGSSYSTNVGFADKRAWFDARLGVKYAPQGSKVAAYAQVSQSVNRNTNYPRFELGVNYKF